MHANGVSFCFWLLCIRYHWLPWEIWGMVWDWRGLHPPVAVVLPSTPACLTRLPLKPERAIITLPLHSYTKVKDVWHLSFSRAHRNSCCSVCDSLIHDDLQGWFTQKWKFKHHVFSLMSFWLIFFLSSVNHKRRYLVECPSCSFLFSERRWGLKTPQYIYIYIVKLYKLILNGKDY